MDIELSAEQAALFEVMERTKQHLFVTGRAGAGKSVLLRHFRDHTAKKVVVAAPTGIAALNVRGQTLHSLFKLPIELYRKGMGTLIPNMRLYSLLRRIDTLVIDEISMVRADVLDAVDERLREAFESDVAFGGIQVIMFGDVYQLPPVLEKELSEYFEYAHQGHFFFNALVWKEADFKVYELTQVFRQKDPTFRDILNAVRDGTVVDEQIAQLNVRHGVSAKAGTVTLAPTNALVTQINQEQLNKLEGKIYKYKALITGEMKKSIFPTEEILQLKKGAQVVLLKNDKDGRWVNGTVGTVEELFDDHIDVNVNGVVYRLERETWEEVVYDYDRETKKVEAKVTSSFTQYPVRLAWALTIHKSQGQTYENVALDLTTATFAHGQLYVALSRATGIEGLYLKMPVKREHIMVDPKVTAFMSRREAIEIAVVEKAQEVIELIHHDEIVINEVIQEQNEVVVVDSVGPVLNNHDEIKAIQDAIEPDLLEGRVSHIVAIEVLCPSCGTPCVDKVKSSPMITHDLVGHAIVCPQCQKFCIVPLNAFSIQGSVIAREKPEAGVTNSKREKKGRTKKERKSTKGRKTKSGVIREPMQLSLDVRTIKALNLMGVNKSQLYEDLLQQYEPFLEAYAAIDTDELDHDENEEEE